MNPRRLIQLLALACLASSCTLPDFGFALPTTQALDACRDQELSAGEADVDCGGICPTACGSGSACFMSADCASGFCSGGKCTAQTCSDKIQNQSETDVDCGGETACARCEPGKACAVSGDCNQGACAAGLCRAPSCDDGIKNQDETDVDCGGRCAHCADGKSCNTIDDCNLSQCADGRCRGQSCSDGLMNGDESDVDCGGTTGCARCTTAQHCRSNADCNDAACSKGSCQPVSCTDGVKNGGESDVDCGIICGKTCADGAGCMSGNDCASQVCQATTHSCQAPSCTDGVRNGSEPTVDCGAGCAKKCGTGDTCLDANDCASGRCLSAHCMPKSATNTPLSSTGWFASASQTNSDSAPRFALDGDPNTSWTSGTGQSPGMWFEVDMLKPQAFFSVIVTSNSQPMDYGRTLRLSGSLDGMTFTELRTAIPGQVSLQVSFADAQFARYIRFETLGSAGTWWWTIDDLTVLE